MELKGTRREILRGLVGVAVASGCRSTYETKGWDGGFVADGSSRGHALRNADPFAAPQHQHRVKALVLGGGVAGLSAAWSLSTRHAVKDIAVLEMMDSAGGTASSGRSDVCAYPWGAHYLPAPRIEEQPELVAFLDAAGVTTGRRADGQPIYAEQFLAADPQERLHYRGSWYEGQYPELGQSEAEAEQHRRFDAVVGSYVQMVDAEGRRAFCLPLRRSADTPKLRALDTMSFAAWLDDHKFDSPRLRWWVRLACRDDYGQPPERVSAWYGLHYFASRVPGLGQASAPFLTWPEGNSFLVKALSKPVQDELHLGHTVRAVRQNVGGVTVVSVDAQGVVHNWAAERVVFALPSFLRPHLLPESPPWDINPNPWLVANLHLRRSPVEQSYPPAWDNLLYEGRGLGYVRATHQIPWSRGASVWTHYLPVDVEEPAVARKRLQSLSYREVADAVVAELKTAHPDLERHLSRVDIRRYGHAMATPAPGTRFSPARATAAQAVGRVHFAHTDLSGVALFEEAFDHGVRAASEIASNLDGNVP